MTRPDLVATALLTFETAAGVGATLAARIDAMRQALEAYEREKAAPVLASGMSADGAAWRVVAVNDGGNENG